MTDIYDLEGDVADAILLGFEEGPSPWTRRAAARVLALLKEKTLLIEDGREEAIERMLAAGIEMNRRALPAALAFLADQGGHHAEAMREHCAVLFDAAVGGV